LFSVPAETGGRNEGTVAEAAQVNPILGYYFGYLFGVFWFAMGYFSVTLGTTTGNAISYRMAFLIAREGC
jgi:hypothetical protein